MKTKKWALPVCILALCALVSLFTSCAMLAQTTDLPANYKMSVSEPEEAENCLHVTSVDFDAQYIRTNGYHEDAEYPAVKIIRSVQELKAYYEANKEKYDLKRKDVSAGYIDTTIGFLNACDRYDDAYFAEHILVMVLLEEGSGSIRHKVDSVVMSQDGQCSIHVDTIVPEMGSCDMAEWHILIEPEAGFEIESEADVTVYVDGINPLTQPKLAWHGRGFANISLTIPHGWEYEIEDYADTDEFCIAFWPAGTTEGKIKAWYCNRFGVCGTGLKEKKITLGKYEALKGTYDGKEVWDFICLIGTPGTYVIWNEGADPWWDVYGDEAMEILNTLVVGDDIISEAEAIAIAKQEATVEYNQIMASYDSENGFWKVMLYQESDDPMVGIAGGDQTVTITCEGKVIDNEYGE